MRPPHKYTYFIRIDAGGSLAQQRVKFHVEMAGHETGIISSVIVALHCYVVIVVC